MRNKKDYRGAVNLININSFRVKDIDSGVDIEEIQKKTKQVIKRKCEIKDCKAYITRGKYCPPHSAEVRSQYNKSYN